VCLGIEKSAPAAALTPRPPSDFNQNRCVGIRRHA
jgi:hypothetical protein